MFVLWRTRSCYLWVFKETWSTCSTRHFYYQSITKGVKQQECPFSIGIVRLDLDASCDENGPNLSLDPTPCFLVLIIVKCSKLVPKHFYFSTLTCFMNKELMWLYKLALVEKNTLMLIEVIDGQNLSLRPVTHETKPLSVTIGSHTIKVVFNVISSPRNHVIIGLSWLILHNPRMD